MKKKPSTFKSTKIVLVACVVLLSLYAFNKRNDYNALLREFTEEKQHLEAELDNISDSYRNISLKNKKLKTKVVLEINKIIALKDAVKKLKVENYAALRQYRKKLGLLREENQKLYSQVDSLAKINTELTTINKTYSVTLEEKTSIASSLEQKNVELKKINEDLLAKIEPATKIQISPVSAIAMKERNNGKLAETTKSSRADVFKVNFKLLENNLADSGEKLIHIQLKDNKDNVVAQKREVVLNNNEKIAISDELTAHYDKEDLEVLSLISIDKNTLEKGDYKINVFVDGKYNSSSVVTLR